MSWLARSLASSLQSDHNDDEGDGRSAAERSHDAEKWNVGAGNRTVEPETPSRGVKEDLSELTETLTRQFWGVASFLAPPPPTPPPPPLPIPSAANTSLLPGCRRPDPADAEVSDRADPPETPGKAGIRNDFAEIGGRFRTGISRLSHNAAVTELSKIASNFLPFGPDEEEDEASEHEESGWTYSIDAVGVTDEVLAYARNISMHPETWLDFPLFSDFEDCDDFDMSDAQLEHALAVEYLLPRLAALRIELCPTHMSEGCFWKIYFILLHSRLNKHDAELLSTHQIVEARGMLLQRLQNQTKPESEIVTKAASYRSMDDPSVICEDQFMTSKIPYETMSVQRWAFEEASPSIPSTDFETEKHPILSTEVKIIDKSVIREEPISAQVKSKDIPSNAPRFSIQKYEDDEDDWPEEETGEMGASGASIHLINEEDVSFSDLEDDDCNMPMSSKTVIPAYSFQSNYTRERFQENKSSSDSGKNDCSANTKDLLNFDDIDAV